MTSTATPPTFTARTPEDVLAVVPILLGFAPADSVVMLTFGGEHTFHARIDLPDDADHLVEMAEALAAPARRHAVEGVVLVLYSDDAVGAALALEALTDALAGGGVRIIDALLTDGGRWWRLLDADPAALGEGTGYDPAAHPFAVRAVVDGRITHASREELAASLRGRDEQLAAEVEQALAERPSVWDPRARAAELRWVESTVRRLARDPGELGDPVLVARLLRACQELDLRDAAWLQMRRDDAAGHVALWTRVLCHAPVALVPAPAALLAFAAWLAGHGALAWCALERCREVDPDYSLAGVIGDALANAVPPSVWERVRETEKTAADPA